MIPVHSGNVETVGFKGGRYFWRHACGLTNSYTHKGRFFMALRDAGLRLAMANDLVERVDKQRTSAGGGGQP